MNKNSFVPEISEKEAISTQNGTFCSLDPKQREIYEGLRSVGPEISAFYVDGVRILKGDDFETKSYLLAHLAREIEGGLRDVLSHKEEEKIEKSDRGLGHIASIAIALGVNVDDPLVKKWFKVAGDFHRYAHRRGVMGIPRSKSEFENLWKEFEDILFNLVGTYYSLLDRVDRILQYETPTKEIIDTLPNLLEVDARRSYFFRNLKSCQWLKPLKEEGYFAPEDNPKPQEISNQQGHYRVPVWHALNYLENVANKNAENPSDETTNLLIEIINSIANHKDEKGERIENRRTDWVLTKIISTLPIEKIEMQHIEFIGTSLKTRWNIGIVAKEIGDTVFPKLLNEKAKDLLIKLIDVVLDYLKVDRVTSDAYVSVMEEYWLDEILKKYKPDIAKLFGAEAAEVCLSKIKSITKEDTSRFSNAWIPTIEESSQTLFPKRYECQLVRFARDMYELSDANKIKEKIGALRREEHPIFKRIAIHTINCHYEDLKDLFWSWDGNLLCEDLLKHELFELLKARCSSFDENQIEQVLDWIESKDYYIPAEIKDKEKRKKVIAYQKKEWLLPLLKTANEKIISSYKKYQEVNPDRIDHPGFIFWVERTAGLAMPTDLTIFLNKTNKEIAEYLRNYKKPDSPVSLSQIDLSTTFEAFVSANPEQFSADLEPFQSIPRMYRYALLLGLREAWQSKKEFTWEALLQFMSKLVESEEFWEERADRRHMYRDLIVSEMACLIEEGTRNDDHAFDVELLPQAEKILLTLAEKTKSDLSEMRDLTTSVLNSAKGRIFSAMLNYSLRQARTIRKGQECRWTEPIKADFSKRLDKAFEPSLEFSFVLGQYLANFYYLDRKWVADNINRIFPKDNNDHWKTAFTGYLIYSRTVYKDLYFLLRENGHYTKALDISFTDRYVTKGLVGHICLGYIEEWEKLGDKTSLIYELIQNGNADQLSELVHFFWTLRDKLTARIKKKVKPVWRALFERLLQTIQNPEYQKLISRLSRWLSLIDEIDDQTLEYLKVSARYAQTNMDAYSFIEYLLKHASTEPEKVSEIYLEMLGAGVYPDFKQEDIEELVQILYDQGQKENADKICNMYGKKGFEFLRTIYQKHRTVNSIEQT